MNARLLSFAGAFIVLASSNVHGEGLSNETSKEAPTIEQLLSRVPDGATWQDLSPDLRADFQKRASSLLVQDRQSWGLSGLQQKEDLLFSAPTPAMTENIDRFVRSTSLRIGSQKQSLFVGCGRRFLARTGEAARPEFLCRNDVALPGDDRYVGGEVEPREQADHEREGAVGAVRFLEYVMDVEPASQLQALVPKSCRNRSAAEAPPGCVTRQDPEREPKEADVQNGRKCDGAEFPDDPKANPNRAEACQSGRQ